MENLELFARKCTCCGGGMNQGYVIGGGAEYYCTDECLMQHYTPEEWKEMTAEDQDEFGFSFSDSDNYWTEWDTEDDDELEYAMYNGEVIDREDLKPRVYRGDFLEWLFSDSEEAKDLGVRVIRGLEKRGSFSIDAQMLFDECGYIPAHILDNSDMFDEDQEFEPSEVILIN